MTTSFGHIAANKTKDDFESFLSKLSERIMLNLISVPLELTTGEKFVRIITYDTIWDSRAITFAEAAIWGYKNS